jgi:hypothetical protein
MHCHRLTRRQKEFDATDRLDWRVQVGMYNYGTAKEHPPVCRSIYVQGSRSRSVNSLEHRPFRPGTRPSVNRHCPFATLSESPLLKECSRQDIRVRIVVWKPRWRRMGADLIRSAPILRHEIISQLIGVTFVSARATGSARTQTMCALKLWSSVLWSFTTTATRSS